MIDCSAIELAEWSNGTWGSSPSGDIKGFSKDTRNLHEGCLYIALKGENYDGHSFIEQAQTKGACAALVNQGDLNEHKGLPCLEVADTKEALKEISIAYRKKVNARMIGITGSAGKSTVKEIANQMISKALPTSSTIGNYNNDIGLPLSLLAMDSSTQVGVFELGTNHPGEIAALCEILQPDIGIITNVAAAHIEYFDTLDAIAEEKGSLLKSVPSDGTVILNRDDPYFEYFRTLTSAKVISVSVNGDADYVCENRNIETNEIAVRDNLTDELIVMGHKLPGIYNVSNILEATAAVRSLGVDWGNIVDALECFTPMTMRWEEHIVDGMMLINDAYNGNPGSMKAAIMAFSEEVPGDKILVLGGMHELGAASAEEHEKLGVIIAGMEWKAVVVLGELGELISKGAQNAGLQSSIIYNCSDNIIAIKVLKSISVAGDAILFKGSRGIKLEDVVKGIINQ